VYNWKERNDDREKMQNRQDWKKYAHTQCTTEKKKKKQNKTMGKGKRRRKTAAAAVDGRMLMLSMTDGVRKVYGIETYHRLIRGIQPSAPLGLKVKCKRVQRNFLAAS